MITSVLQIMLRTLIYGARQIVTVTRSSNETFLCGKDMQNIGIIKSNDAGLSLMINTFIVKSIDYCLYSFTL